MVVNGKPISEYFKGDVFKKTYNAPFLATDSLGQFTGSVKVAGSGLMGQVDALVHGIARALIKVNPEGYKQVLRDKGFLTRDPRMKETRKPGQGGKARSKKQLQLLIFKKIPRWVFLLNYISDQFFYLSKQI
jgi:small subunit ribosomal protein S9